MVEERPWVDSRHNVTCFDISKCTGRHWIESELTRPERTGSNIASGLDASKTSRIEIGEAVRNSRMW